MDERDERLDAMNPGTRITMSDEVCSLLSNVQREIVTRELEHEEAQREHLVVALSGAHAYGFPSPDSDVDLKAIHIAKTEALLGLTVPATTVDHTKIVDGVEIDYTSNELGQALSGMLAGNGNYLERVLGHASAHQSPLLAELRPIVQRALSRRVHKHYRGFAISQWRLAEKEPTVKKLLYVLRTATTGMHVLVTGHLETDLTKLADRYGLSDALALVEQKRAGEQTGLAPAQLEAWRPRVEQLLASLDRACEESILPAQPADVDELESWLLRVRRAHLESPHPGV